MSTLLFVYGTLKRGQCNHALLAGQEFLGLTRTLPHYRLHHCGPYPGLVPAPNAGIAVEGELWRVDDATLRRLDDFEERFERREIALQDRDEPAFVGGGVVCGEGFPTDQLRLHFSAEKATNARYGIPSLGPFSCRRADERFRCRCRDAW